MSQVQMIVVCVTSVVIAACQILQECIVGVMVATRIRLQNSRHANSKELLEYKYV